MQRSYELEIGDLYWAGPSERWGGRSRHELTIDGLARACQWWYGPRQSTGMTLDDLMTALKLPDSSPAALRWT